MASIIQDLQRFGAGIFVASKGIDSRLGEAEVWRAYEEPVIVGVHGKDFGEDDLNELLELVQKLPHISKFRFTGTKITHKALEIV